MVLAEAIRTPTATEQEPLVTINTAHVLLRTIHNGVPSLLFQKVLVGSTGMKYEIPGVVHYGTEDPVVVAIRKVGVLISETYRSPIVFLGTFQQMTWGADHKTEVWRKDFYTTQAPLSSKMKGSDYMLLSDDSVPTLDKSVFTEPIMRKAAMKSLEYARSSSAKAYIPFNIAVWGSEYPQPLE